MRTILRMVDAMGDQARPFLEQAPPPAEDGEVLVVLVDGKGAPMINGEEYRRRRRPRDKSGSKDRHARRRARHREPPRPRKTKGKKNKNAKVAFVGVLYGLHRTADGQLDGPMGKRLMATFKSHEALFQWLRKEADKRGYGVKKTLFIADGSDHIWRHQQTYFPEADVCLDWYHVAEKVWKAGECLFAEGTDKLQQWVEEQLGRLRHGKCDELLDVLSKAHDGIPKTGPGNRGKRQRLLDVQEHLTKHRHRMRYDELRRQDLDIGSGAVEGAVRNLVGMRLDGPGMRWSRGRSERLLYLRCILLNGQWDDFEKYIAAQGAPRLPSVPIPTETHDAKAAA